MSSTTEFLLEQIKLTEFSLEEARRLGDERSFVALNEKLNDLKIRFHVSSEALYGSRSILKG